MNNFLVPFNFQAFQSSEAVWDIGSIGSNKEYVRMFRMTRRGWGEFFGAKNPQAYMDILKHRYPYLPEGIPFTVKGMTGQEYVVYALDIFEGHDYAVESELPRAKEFLRRFPTFLMALMERKIKPPTIGKIKPQVLAYINMPYKEKRAYRERVYLELGWHRTKFFRECNKAEAVLNVSIVNQHRTRSDKGAAQKPEERKRLIEFVSNHPEYLRVKGGNRFKQFRQKDLKGMLGLTVSEGCINRWIRER